MVLLVGIGSDLLSTFYAKMNKGTLNFEELGVMLVFCFALLMADYAAVLNDIVAILDTPRRQITPSDRRAITSLLDAMTDVNAMMVYHFNCRRLPPENLAELRAKVACLASRGM